jgi:gamma-glutamyltranspeptidase/glutathione hydrolase
MTIKAKLLGVLLVLTVGVLAGLRLGGPMTGDKEIEAAAPAEQSKGGDRVVGAPWATRSAVLGTNGMAATSHPLASQIAIDILKAGGNAVDAAIAANAALGLMEPTGNGIGGDFFVIVWDPETKKLYGLNGSGRAPRGQSLEELKARLGPGATALPDWGSLSVSVPGAVDGWYTLHARFGSMDMKEVLAPAIRYAGQGFPVTQLVSYYMEVYRQRYERLGGQGIIEEIENYRHTYLVDGKVPAEGQIFKNPDLANTLQAIADGGRDAFYKGQLARTMAAYMERIGGPLTYEDFASHASEWVEPQAVNYRGYDVFELPPNGQGIAALQMLNILEGFDLEAMGHNTADYLHVMAEAKKLAFADRARFYADPAFYEADLDYLLSKDYAAERRALIDMSKAALEVDHGDPKLVEGDTINLTVADTNGMMVSLIQSNYRGMGSGLVPDGLGFIFQDRGALFSLDPDHPNVYKPGKRPFHTIIPAFVLKDGAPWLSFGLMGGAMQPQGHVQILVNMIDFAMGVQEAGDVARYHHKGHTEPFKTGSRMSDGGILEVESGVSLEVVEALRVRGHVVEYAKGPFGGYQAILFDAGSGVYRGASEMRKDGAAIGY